MNTSSWLLKTQFSQIILFHNNNEIGRTVIIQYWNIILSLNLHLFIFEKSWNLYWRQQNELVVNNQMFR